MKYLFIIILAFTLSCKVVIPYGDAMLWSEWEQYEKDCYNDSTMTIIDRNNGTVNESSIVFEKDTVWTHKTPDVNDFFKRHK
jgi:hypothetical protein